MHCEICGSEIRGEPAAVEVDKAVLYVCSRCAAIYGKRALRQQYRQAPPAATPRPRREPVSVEIVENFGEVVRAARESLGLSREALAAMLGVKESVLRRVEAGQLQPDVSLARKLERVLRVRLLVREHEGGQPESGAVRRELTLGEVAEIREE
ncbi:MAG: multiprotein bridging factor aMBF1 [Thermoproteaceae archaeon]|jgi:putative transcription factor|nr:multiprotein bridging factor aMBF1 [Thermoproteaceae archaeon]